MAWTKVYYDTSRQDQVQGTYNASDQSQTVQVLRTMVAVSDSPTTNMIAAMSATDGTLAVPSVGGVYAIDSVAGFTCTQVLPRRTKESPNVFEILTTFERKSAVRPASEAGSKVWNVDVQFSGIKFTQSVYNDRNDDPIVNSAGEPFDPSLTKTYYDEQITISFQTTSPPYLGSYYGKCNSSACSFTIRGQSRTYDKRHLLFDQGEVSASLNLADDTSTPVWTVRLTLIGRTDEFTDEVVDKGCVVLDSDGKVVHARDDNGEILPGPFLLNGNGKRLLPTDATPDPLKFEIVEEADLSPIFADLSD